MTLMRNNVIMSDDAFSINLSGVENYYSSLLDNYKESLIDNPVHFFIKYSNCFLDFVNNHNGDDFFNQVILNSLSNQQLYNLTISATNMFMSFLSVDEKKKITDDFNFTLFMKQYYNIFDMMVSEININLSKYNDRSFEIGFFTNKIVNELVSSYFANLPDQYKHSLSQNSDKYFEFYKKIYVQAKDKINRIINLGYSENSKNI